MRLLYVRRVRRTTHQFHEKKKRKRREEKKKRRSFSGAGGRRERRERERDRERERRAERSERLRDHTKAFLCFPTYLNHSCGRERETQKVKKDGA